MVGAAMIGALIMATLNNQMRAIIYGCSELGELATISADGTTVSSVLARDHKTAVLSGATILQAVAHVKTIHPNIDKVTG
jgi:hypothetical protein